MLDVQANVRIGQVRADFGNHWMNLGQTGTCIVAMARECDSNIVALVYANGDYRFIVAPELSALDEALECMGEYGEVVTLWRSDATEGR